jgi:hypothetical protein
MKTDFSIKEFISLQEVKLKKGQLVLIDEIEIDLSSPEGELLLQQTIENLSCLKNSYKMGSSTRHILSQACSRLKKILMMFH